MDRTVLVHGDYKPTNLLVGRSAAGTWEVRAVLDREFALASSPFFDIGQLLRWSHRYPADFEAGFEAGYGAVHALPSEWRELARVHDLLNIVQFLAGEERVRMFADVRALVDLTLQALTSSRSR